ncbi:chorion peroxidase-like [Pollicipes pollicipes]|uniref:chorion peroxidase-like n=1 Tax=Pollicipes pollicipes TaxID=41117 RepID=UPI001885A0EE|nr:chorion peroxidase-like [Pollicipes pollicipes]
MVASIFLMLPLLLTVAADTEPELPPFLTVMERETVAMPPDRLAAALSWARGRLAAYPAATAAKAPRHSGRRSHYHMSRHDSDSRVQALAHEALVWVEAARAPANLSAARTDVECPTEPAPSCDFDARFRRQDGACNNRRNPTWGASDTAIVRLAANTYDDGVDAPRSVSAAGGALPTARSVSAGTTGSTDDENTALTLSVVNWGQFMDHDITLSPVQLAAPGVELDCCVDGVVADDAHPRCLPIDVPEDDAFYGALGERCMEFARSVPAVPAGCSAGPANPVNVLTAFIDASNVYGSRESRATLVRAGEGGRLLIQRGALLPRDPPGVQIDTETPCFSPDPEGRPCFLAGDVRATEQSGLATMHTVWMREHNRLARGLARVNPEWDDERLFQEARRIVGAEIQHITYNEWLPLLVGEAYMRRMRIGTQRRGYSRRYSPRVNPSIATEFSTAAFRVGHTLIQGELELYPRVASSSVSLRINLRDVFFDPTLIYDGRLDQIAIGMITQHPQTCDANIAEDLTEFLFQEEGHAFGLDLIALNVQRGRDHGIATYNTMRARCGLTRVTSFAQLLRQIPADVVRRLRSVYAHVDDIDLFVGAVSERPVPGAAVGPTIQCIVGDQFARLRWGDNFFYDLGGRPWSFTRVQLDQLRRVSWARVLCDNIRSIRGIQRSAFQAAGRGNSITACRNLPSMNLRAWGSAN